jgi:serine/threonine protein kinase
MPQDGSSGEIEPYRLGRRLESDSTGETFETSHTLIAGPCAIKILRRELTGRPDAAQAFETDLRALAQLRHPNVLHIVDVAEALEGHLVVTERLEGRTLAERLAEQGTLPLAQAVPIIRGAAAALQAAHQIGITHGELNPRNIFLARMEGYEQGVVKLREFGIAKLRALDAAASLPVEIVRYLSPEQAAGRSGDVDGRTDQYALALIAYRMLCGSDVVDGDSVLSVLSAIVHEQPVTAPLAEVAPAVEPVIRRALARSRADRYESVVAFARALETAVATQLGTPPPVLTRPTPIQVPVNQLPVNAAPAVDPDPFLTHPFFSPEMPRPRRRRVIIVRRRRSGTAQALLVMLAIGAASLAGAMAAGWRPPLAWRQSALWNDLRLPGAAPAGDSSPR